MVLNNRRGTITCAGIWSEWRTRSVVNQRHLSGICRWRYHWRGLGPIDWDHGRCPDLGLGRAALVQQFRRLELAVGYWRGIWFGGDWCSYGFGHSPRTKPKSLTTF